MPSRWTFTIKPIAELLSRYVGDGKGWVDPFCGETSPAEYKNDLNPENKHTASHLDANDYLSSFKSNSMNGVILDPPYSPRQVSDCYKGIGKEVTSIDTQGRPLMRIRNASARIIKPGGFAIVCGWNSCGLGKAFGFEMIEILLVSHSIIVNDTIVTVERKIQGNL